MDDSPNAGVLLPPNGGLDALRASDRLLRKDGQTIVIVLDNVHRLRPNDFRQIVESAPKRMTSVTDFPPVQWERNFFLSMVGLGALYNQDLADKIDEHRSVHPFSV